jgi:hypothetical protein
MANDRTDTPLAVPKNPLGLTDDDYREAVQNIRTFFTLLDSWDSGLDAVKGPGYDGLSDFGTKED